MHAIVVDALQGGAGTSTNMNVNEVLANRALQILGRTLGDYQTISPHDDFNRYQSTNDTYPTAVRIAAIRLLRELETRITELVDAFQDRERALADVVKVGRTQLQDAVLTTLGRSMGAYADALARDRWRIYKCEERLRVVNLGGIGHRHGPRRAAASSSSARSRSFVQITGLGLARAENMIDGTQNVDALVEVSGITKACRHQHHQGFERSPPARLGTGCGAGRDHAPRASGRLIDHAGQGEPRHPGGRRPVRHRGLRP
jgi:aspartate ammonia-lyase